MTIIERAAVLGIGLWLGIAVSRTDFEPGALPIYGIAAGLIIAARMVVIRRRERGAS